jgi:hypothetical protein
MDDGEVAYDQEEGSREGGESISLSVSSGLASIRKVKL